MSNRFPQRPKRKLDPIIYRRRRIFFGGAALIVILLLWWLVGSVVGAVNNFFNPTPQPAISAPAAQAGQPCAPGTVTVIAGIGDANQVSASTFAKGVNPYLWFKLTNNGTVACTFDAGSAVSFYKITSGSETIWDSIHCDRTQDTNAVITLQPSQEVSSPASNWMRVYSSTSGCSTGQKPVAGGGASYHLTATVGGVISNDVQFVLN
jgi:hypothetical protein